MNEVLTITSDNIEKYICCSVNKNLVQSRQSWLESQLPNGLILKELSNNRNAFIEYVPAESAFAPIFAPNYMYINNLCVTHKSYRNNHYGSSDLLKLCIEDVRKMNKDGIVAVSTPIKQPFIISSDLLRYKGFYTADIAFPCFELLYLPFYKHSCRPKFHHFAKKGRINQKHGVTLYYTNQCPFVLKHMSFLEEVVMEHQISFRKVHLKTIEQAQKSPCPSTTYSLFINGKLQLSESLSKNKFLDLAFNNNAA